MNKIRYLIFILMPMLLIGIFGMRANASNAPSIDPNLKYSPELFVINEGYTTYLPNLDITADLDMDNDFYFNRSGTVLEFRIYDISYFRDNFNYEVLVIDIMELFYILEERELVDNLEDLVVSFTDDYNVELPYYYEYFDSHYYIYIGDIDGGAINRVDFTMTLELQYDRTLTFNDQVFAHNTSIRFMKEWEDYLSIKEYYMLAVERDHNAHTNYQRGYRDGYNKGYQDGWFKGFDDDKAFVFQEGYDEGYNLGFLNGLSTEAEDAYRQGFYDGVEDTEHFYYNHATNSFMRGLEKWIVPAILIVLLLGGFFVMRSNRNRGE